MESYILGEKKVTPLGTHAGNGHTHLFKSRVWS